MKNIKNMAMPKRTFLSLGTFVAGYVFNSKADTYLERQEWLKKLPFFTPTTWASGVIVIGGVLLKQAPIATFGLGGLTRDFKDQYISSN